jgi:hypothetical protein
MAEPHTKKPGFLRSLSELVRPSQPSGSASPTTKAFFETSVVPLEDVMKLYERDPTCKSSVDLLSAFTVGMGFYTTCAEGQEKAKETVDGFCEEVNLDRSLNDMAKPLIACGNDFWLKLTPEKLADLVRLPVDAVGKVRLGSLEGFKIPYGVGAYELEHKYQIDRGSGSLNPEAVIHWQLNSACPSGFGVGLLQVLIHTLTISSDKRPAYAWMKAKIEKIMPKIFEKYAGPDVLASLPDAKEATIQKFESAIRNRSEEGAWLFYSGKNPAKLDPVTIDPRARFEFYVEHIVNQFYLGCETPLPRLFSTPGFTEASANAALDLQDMLIKPIQRYIKRQIERDIFSPILRQARFEPSAAGVRLNWGSPETPELVPADLIHAAQLGLIRSDEFRKNAVKFGWELWEDKAAKDTRSIGGDKF